MKPEASLVSPARFSIVVTNLKNKRTKTWYFGEGFSSLENKIVVMVCQEVAHSITRMVSASGNGAPVGRKRVKSLKK